MSRDFFSNSDFLSGSSRRGPDDEFSYNGDSTNPIDVLNELGIDFNNFKLEDYFDDGVVIVPPKISVDNREKFINAILKLKEQSDLGKESLDK
ncbi:MAG: hypothetical protein WC070_00335 [Candidatus Magasanikbacteria bacterium]